MIGESVQSSLSSHPTGGCDMETTASPKPDEWLEETMWQGLRRWHVMFLSMGIVLSLIILLCCCIKFRIPRTKQEIEGDFIRRKIMRKFRKRLKAIQNQELDEMDLKKALDKIRTELKSDTESLQQSDVLSGTTLSSAAMAGGPTYRRASQIQIDISLEDLRIQSMGIGTRIALAVSRFFGRTPKRTTPPDVVDAEEGQGTTGDTIDKPTVALLSNEEGKETSKKKKGDGKTSEAASSRTLQPVPKIEISSKDGKGKVAKSKDKEVTPSAKSSAEVNSKGNGKKDKGSSEEKAKKSQSSSEKTDKGASGTTGSKSKADSSKSSSKNDAKNAKKQ